MIVRVAVLCGDGELGSFRQGVEQYARSCKDPVHGEYHPGARGFLDALQHDSLWDLLIVAVPGARGMEAVVSARELAPETPLLWCSDDPGFAVASYRLRCSLFLPLPLNREEVASAMARCLETHKI